MDSATIAKDLRELLLQELASVGVHLGIVGNNSSPHLLNPCVILIDALQQLLPPQIASVAGVLTMV